MAKLDEKAQSIVRRGTIELDDLKDILRDNFDVPRYADFRFTIEVPSGGDYSGCTLDVEDDGPQAIRFTAEWTE